MGCPTRDSQFSPYLLGKWWQFILQWVWHSPTYRTHDRNLELWLRYSDAGSKYSPLSHPWRVPPVTFHKKSHAFFYLFLKVEIQRNHAYILTSGMPRNGLHNFVFEKADFDFSDFLRSRRTDFTRLAHAWALTVFWTIAGRNHHVAGVNKWVLTVFI